MLNLMIDVPANRRLKILCLGAHSDDLEIGCGGTILRFLESRPDIEMWWVVFSARDEREQEALRSAELFLQGAVRKEVMTRSFRDGFFPYVGGQIKEFFEEMKRMVSPDLVFTHYRHDLHQDHRLISELTWNTFRDHYILEYEIVKYDGDTGNPDTFVHLTRATCERKVSLIRQCFRSQSDHRWFSETTYYAILRLRGVQSNAPDGYAEAYYARKASLALPGQP